MRYHKLLMGTNFSLINMIFFSLSLSLFIYAKKKGNTEIKCNKNDYDILKRWAIVLP